MRLLSLIFCFCLLSLEAEEILWIGKRVSLVHQEGLLALAMNRSAPIHTLLNEEKIEFETTIGKMQTVFEQVFGFGDFTRWMPLQEERLISYLLPVGAYANPIEINAELKIQTMLFALKGSHFPLLSQEHLAAIQIASVEILDTNPLPVVLEDGVFSYTKTREAFLLLQEQIDDQHKWTSPHKTTLSFSTKCNSFCNPNNLAKQIVHSSSLHAILYKTRPYTEHQLLIVPKRHITSLSENTREEILDKWDLLIQIQSIALKALGYPKIGVMTRIGWRAGQTQAHLHDHVIPYDPLANQPWLFYWAHELSHGAELPSDFTQWEETRNTWQTLYRLYHL